MSDRPRVLVLGAGIVGVSCALALQERGFAVTLADRRGPGEETSHGNAGVITRSSLIPLNHPRLWRTIPALLGNRALGFRYDAQYLRRNLPWAMRFLWNARRSVFVQTTQALDALIRHSMSVHAVWRTQAGLTHRYRDEGWLYLYRDRGTYEAAAWQRAAWRSFGVNFETLDVPALRALEPALAPIYPRAVWIRDACSVDQPGAVVQALAQWFAARGGTLLRVEVPTAQWSGGRWRVACGTFDHLVVALGPWSADFLKTLGIHVPMAFERGYHQHFHVAAPTLRPTRPFYDVSGGYVAAPMDDGVRVSTGVELNALAAPIATAQMEAATTFAKQALSLGEPTLETLWLGARPTLPDSRPVIGRSTRFERLWLAFGHQHIGFSTGPGTGTLLAEQMSQQTSSIDLSAFAPARFRL